VLLAAVDALFLAFGLLIIDFDLLIDSLIGLSIGALKNDFR
jgi:hypothetical protein